jgi:hypothetical protein
MADFAINPGRRVMVRKMGAALAPLICIDDFSLHPERLVEHARRADFIDVGSQYPGVRAPVPDGYVRALLTVLAPLIEPNFGAPPESDLDLCAFSMVTTPPAQLAMNQRMPHIDGPEDRRIAFLHYLCDPSQGGTSFYRHRSTALEVVTAADLRRYHDSVVAELRQQPPPAAYVSGDTRHFKHLGRVDAAFNRLVVYKGNALHSGDIGPGTLLGEDPRRGRLTINGFGFLCS